jgi:HxlR-like helix-turn-helix protein
MKPDGSDFDRLLLDQIADRWSILVLGSICAAGGALRFNELRRQVSGVAQKTLTQCLRRLERPPPFPAARPEAVPPGHPCGATLPHPATPVQHQPQSRGAALRLAAGRASGRGRRAGRPASARGAAGPAAGAAGAA